MAGESDSLPEPGAIAIRLCKTLPEFEQCTDVQRAVWGYSDLDIVPAPMFLVAQKTGGHVLGAFDGGRMVGFALAYAAVRNGVPHVHSHFVGVLPEYQDRGIGRDLKLRQREECLRAGIHLLEWTFDPLEVKNACFNISRLGAIIRKFHPNLYGMTSSHLHGSLPTDRLVAEWHLDSARVRDTLAGQTRRARKPVGEISLPASIGSMKMENPSAVRSVQSRMRTEFVHWFAKGCVVTEFEVDANSARYILEEYAD